MSDTAPTLPELFATELDKQTAVVYTGGALSELGSVLLNPGDGTFYEVRLFRATGSGSVPTVTDHRMVAVIPLRQGTYLLERHGGNIKIDGEPCKWLGTANPSQMKIVRVYPPMHEPYLIRIKSEDEDKLLLVAMNEETGEIHVFYDGKPLGLGTYDYANNMGEILANINLYVDGKLCRLMLTRYHKLMNGEPIDDQDVLDRKHYKFGYVMDNDRKIVGVEITKVA